MIVDKIFQTKINELIYSIPKFEKRYTRASLGNTGWIDPLEKGFAYLGKVILCEHIFRYVMVARDILEILHTLRKEIKILDVGCGTGYGSKILYFLLNNNFCRKNKVEYVGIDIDEKAISEALKKYLINNANFSQSFKVANVYELSEKFEKGTFDVIIFFGVVEHLDKPMSALSEIKKLLKVNGRLYISTPNRLYPPRMIYNKLLGAPLLSNPTHVFEYSWQEFLRFVKELKGFEIIKVYGQNILPPKVGDFILKLLPTRFHYSIIMGLGRMLPWFSRDFIAVLKLKG
jgi:2-polyprenyl-3-methyl-5-hydroxy-6-metoxy-1,4-benzoquinol methylase